ncbi:MAG: DUF1566 domain-containing protein [Proteobacteria bacterium]|nr:DUF1566 domain-containing protein [Pseudomonadota bacterium]MBU1639627.1 DUF1566 domain-containing protein [Pseudomonadota bacterium]
MKIYLQLLFVVALGLAVTACNSDSDSTSYPPVITGSSDDSTSGSSAAAINLAKTGQATCYNTAGAIIACAGTGQDGDLLMGVAWPVPRFTDNSDGTVMDNLTGLMWMQNANCIDSLPDGSFDSDGTANDGRVFWQHGLDFVAAVNGATYGCNVTTSYTDWRLPNIRELESLVDLGQGNPALPSGHPFTGVVSSYYWSSSSVETMPNFAWNLNCNNGIVSSNGKVAATSYVWLVRAGQ